MSENLPAGPWGCAAIVSYLPDPLWSCLHDLRGSLPGGHNPQAHITILPPRQLSVPVETAARQARTTLRRFSAFAVNLDSVRTFSETNVLYIALGEGDATVRRLHEALNTGDLAAAEQFEFRPHLTISGPIPEQELAEAQQLAERAWGAATCQRDFMLSEIAFLTLRPDSDGEWMRLWSHSLKRAKTAAALTGRTY